MVGIIVKGGDGKPDRILEKHIVMENGDKEITFMSEERKNELKSSNQFVEYLEHFKKFEGKEINKGNIYKL